jgi:SAM-dependent methyltransferase
MKLGRFSTLLLLWGVPAHAQSPDLEPTDPCPVYFSSRAVVKKGQDISLSGQAVVVNEIVVTGGDHYSLENIFDGLKIIFPDIWDWAEKGKKVISIGEGYSQLLPYLVEDGVSIQGVDLWYDQTDALPNNEVGRRMRAYVEKNRANLIAADARNLPFANESIDVALSFRLYNNFNNSEDILKSIREVARVLRPGGEARLYLGKGKNPVMVAIIEAELKELAEKYTGRYRLHQDNNIAIFERFH